MLAEEVGVLGANLWTWCPTQGARALQEGG